MTRHYGLPQPPIAPPQRGTGFASGAATNLVGAVLIVAIIAVLAVAAGVRP